MIKLQENCGALQATLYFEQSIMRNTLNKEIPMRLKFLRKKTFCHLGIKNIILYMKKRKLEHEKVNKNVQVHLSIWVIICTLFAFSREMFFH